MITWLIGCVEYALNTATEAPCEISAGVTACPGPASYAEAEAACADLGGELLDLDGLDRSDRLVIVDVVSPLASGRGWWVGEITAFGFPCPSMDRYGGITGQDCDDWRAFACEGE